MFNEPYTLTWRSYTKDKYGTISSPVDTAFKCFLEEEDRVRYISGQLQLIGIGTIFTTSTLGFKEGDEVVINSVVYKINKISRLGDLDGVYHHSELIYG